MDKVFCLSRQELYDEAQEFKKAEDWDNYFIYLTMSANLEHKVAEKELMKACSLDYEGCSDFEKQKFEKTKPFYKLTQEYSYSLHFLGFIVRKIEGNIEEGLKFQKQAMSLGNSFAICSVAYYYFFNANYTLAKELGQQGFVKGNFIGAKVLAESYEREGYFNDAINYYETAIEMGDKHSLSLLADLYRTIRDVKGDRYIHDYFLERYPEGLKNIYGYGSDIIVMLLEGFEAKKEVEKLRKENEEMRGHIMASPDGPLFFEALKDWKEKREVLQGLKN